MANILNRMHVHIHAFRLLLALGWTVGVWLIWTKRHDAEKVSGYTYIHMFECQPPQTNTRIETYSRQPIHTFVYLDPPWFDKLRSVDLLCEHVPPRGPPAGKMDFIYCNSSEARASG